MRFHSYMWWPAGACYLHGGLPESFHLAACHGQKTIFHVVNSVFRVLQVKPEEEDLKETQNFTSYLLSNFTKHLIVTMGHIAMEKQHCLWKHLMSLQSKQSLPLSQRKYVLFHTLVYLSIGFAPLFIPLPSGTARSMDTNQDSCCFNDQERKELQRPCNSLRWSLGTCTITGGCIVVELS